MTEKQRQRNLIVEKKRMEILKNSDHWWHKAKIEQLNHCQATVFDSENYLLLRSYQTVVAGIDKKTGNCYDWLRLVYGYTATSAQHIRKFSTQYGNGVVKSWKER